MRHTFITLLLLGFLPMAQAQESNLDAYIKEALCKNQSLQTQQINLNKALYALQEAHALFLPNVSFGATYNKSQGGRTIDFPVGDLLNPVYKSLNQLTSSNNFGQLQNVSIQLNPDNYYDARFRTTLPLVDAELYYNKRIKQQQISQTQASINVYKRELVKEVKTAYYHYWQAAQAVEIYNNALTLINENIRVNESLLRNGVRNSTSLTRAQTEKEKIEASITQAKNDELNAQQYFNFLLNRSLDGSIVMDSVAVDAALLNLQSGSATNREELTQIKSAQETYSLVKKLESAYLIPKLNTFIDLGSQGFNFKYNNKTQYYFWGVNLQWNLFAGGAHKARIMQANADVDATASQYHDTENAIRLQSVQASNNLNSALAAYASAKTQLHLAEKYYADQLKVYKAGQLLYLELLDALTQFTNAQLQVSVTSGNVLIAYAAAERANATYSINQ